MPTDPSTPISFPVTPRMDPFIILSFSFFVGQTTSSSFAVAISSSPLPCDPRATRHDPSCESRFSAMLALQSNGATKFTVTKTCYREHFLHHTVFWPHPLPWRRSSKHLVDRTKASCQPLHLQAFQEVQLYRPANILESRKWLMKLNTVSTSEWKRSI